MWESSGKPLVSKGVVIALNSGYIHLYTRCQARYSALCRHHHALLRRSCVLFLPQTRDCLCLRVEIQSRPSIEIVGASTGNALLISSERESGRKRHRDGNIDADLSGFDVFLEMRRGAARAGENSDAVAVLVRVDELNSSIEGGHFQRDEDGAEDFLRVAFHVRTDIGNESRADLGVEC